MSARGWLFVIFFALVSCRRACAGDLSTVKDALNLPRPGDTQLLCLTPELLELTLVTTKPPDPAPAAQWNFAGLNGQLHLPATNEVVVTVAGTNYPVIAIGFRRRVLYAPLKKSDLRIGSYLYLQAGQSHCRRPESRGEKSGREIVGRQPTVHGGP